MPTMPNGNETVQLGDRLFPVVPQKHAKVRKVLSGDLFSKLMTRNYGEETYKLITLLIPAVKPENGGMAQWEYEGFPTETLWKEWQSGDEDAYDENTDPGPTTDQIVYALERALMVGGAQRLGKLVNLVTAMGSLSPAQPTATPQDSPGESGE